MESPKTLFASFTSPVVSGRDTMRGAAFSVKYKTKDDSTFLQNNINISKPKYTDSP